MFLATDQTASLFKTVKFPEKFQTFSEFLKKATSRTLETLDLAIDR